MAEKPNSTVPRRAAWLELYTVQKSRAPQKAPVTERGRPRRIATLKSIHTSIAESDEALVIKWQKRFLKLAGRNLTLGEVAGLLARICDERFLAVSGQGEIGNIETLVDLLVGESPNGSEPGKTRSRVKSQP